MPRAILDSGIEQPSVESHDPGLSVRYPKIDALKATPTVPAPLNLCAIIPATRVPWRSLSENVSDARPVAISLLNNTFVSKSICEASTPESTTPILIPLP